MAEKQDEAATSGPRRGNPDRIKNASFKGLVDELYDRLARVPDAEQ